MTAPLIRNALLRAIRTLSAIPVRPGSVPRFRQRLIQAARSKDRRCSGCKLVEVVIEANSGGNCRIFVLERHTKQDVAFGVRRAHQKVDPRLHRRQTQLRWLDRFAVFVRHALHWNQPDRGFAIGDHLEKRWPTTECRPPKPSGDSYDTNRRPAVLALLVADVLNAAQQRIDFAAGAVVVRFELAGEALLVASS